VQAHCDELRDLIGLGPGSNPEMLAKTLGVLRLLRGAAEWDFPQHMLADLKERFTIWFSDRAWRGDTAELHGALVRDVEELCAAWERPKSDGWLRRPCPAQFALVHISAVSSPKHLSGAFSDVSILAPDVRLP
jgi:hypothetical protein